MHIGSERVVIFGLFVARGFIDAEKMEKMFPPPESDVKIFVCGVSTRRYVCVPCVVNIRVKQQPPPMYNVLCGPREDEELSGVLADMGYKKEQVYKF